MEVLTAYVRQNAPLRPNLPYVEGEKPRTDIQAILTVLGRRKLGPDRERPKNILNLSSSRLCGANMYQTDMRKAYLAETDFQHAYFGRADLFGANLRNVNMVDVKVITKAQVSSTRNWRQAYYSPAFRAELGLSPEDTPQP